MSSKEHISSAKILHVIRPAEGGMKEHLLSLVRGLRFNGYVIDVACPGTTVLADELTKAGFKVFIINMVGPLSLKNDLICIIQLKRLISKGHYDIVHFHGSKAGFVGRIAALLAGNKNIVLTVHNFIVYQEVPIFKRVLFCFGEMILSRVTRKMVTVSEALRKDLMTVYKIPQDKIISIYNGIDCSVFDQVIDKHSAKRKLGINSNRFVVGTVARMAPQKGLEYFIEAIALISEVSNAFFVITGDGPLRPELEKTVGRLGISDRVLFTGLVQNVRDVMAAFDVFVIPSICEGLSITAIEASACGIPVVASGVGGLPEVVINDETGLIVPPRNPEAIFGAVIKLLGNSTLREELGSAGLRIACSKFGVQTMVNKTDKVYRSITFDIPSRSCKEL